MTRFLTWPGGIFTLLLLTLLTACGATRTPSPQPAAVDTAPKEMPPEEKYSFLFDTTPAPPPPDTMLDQLPRLPDFVIAPDTMMYRGKATLFARLPYNSGPGSHGNDLSPKEGDFAEEYFAVNARNYIALTDKFGAALHIIGPDGKHRGTIENLEYIDGPLVFLSDSLCAFQTGYPDPENRTIPYYRDFAEYGLGETITVVNIFTRSIVSETRLPDAVAETAVLPSWHSVSFLRRLRRGELDYPPMRWRIGSVPIWEVADPGTGRGWFGAAERVMGETRPLRIYPAQQNSFAYFDLKASNQRFYTGIDGDVGQTADGRLFGLYRDSVRGVSLIGNKLIQTEEYADPLRPLDDEHPNGGKIVAIPQVSATGRVIWIYRTTRGVEIYKAERPLRRE